MRIMCCIKYNLFKESYLRRDIMKKFALTTLAVMAAIGVLAVQPADAKKVQQDPSMAIIDMPMNDEIQQVNGVSKSANKETQRLSNKLADATRVMVKKNWKPSILKLYLQEINQLYDSITQIKMVKYIMAKSLEIQAYPKVNI